jgi:hypothetical protein
MATRWLLTSALAAVCLVAFASALASAAPATTTPGVVYVVKVTLTNSSITIPKDKFSLHSPYPRLPRGAVIRYAITNKGTRAYTFKMWDTVTTVLKPHGGRDSFLVNWNYRGRYAYETLYHGKPAGPHGFVTVF